MERLTKRVWVFAGVLLAYGAVLQFAPETIRSATRSVLNTVGFKTTAVRVAKEEQNEEWMKHNSPKDFDAYKFEPGQDDPEVTYRMDQPTYDELRPWGIVARRFSEGHNVFDAVLIASESKDSFHDPRVCFTAQKFEIVSETVAGIKTKTRGVIPVTLAEMKGPMGRTTTVFFYKGPNGFRPTTEQLKMDMFLTQCKTMLDPQGVFYRFISMNPDTPQEVFFKFIADFVDKAGETSKGFF